ncbi:MAG: PolC-type DNA polymerase III [Clostridia bacterium]|nr:PolC-type DNA polymerase III [Clostridia bacterium]
MSEIWRDALSKTMKDVAQLLTLERVKTNRAGTYMTVILDASRILTDTERVRLKNGLQGLFEGTALELVLRYPALGEALTRDVSAFREYISRRVGRQMPSLKAPLEGAAWSLEGTVLSVDFRDQAIADMARERGAEGVISALLKDEFGLGVAVRCVSTADADARLREIVAKQVEEDQRLAQEAAKAAQEKKPADKPQNRVIYGRSITGNPIPMSELTEDAGEVILEGEIITAEIRPVKNDTMLVVSFTLTDSTNTVYCKAFPRRRGGDEPADPFAAFNDAIKPGAYVRVRGDYQMDTRQREMVVMLRDISRADKPVRVDKAPRKRVELHMHTQMSAMDGLASAGDLIARAAKWGHPAVAITDHGVLQAFPEAFGAAKKNGIKLLPGCEGYLIEDAATIVERADDRPLEGGVYVVLDVETTGLSTGTDKIIEIGAVRLENGVETASFSQLINPGRPIPQKVVELTGITDAMVAGQPSIGDVIGDFAAFCEGAVLCAHNASFDMAFFDRAFRAARLPFEHPKLDTLALVRNLYPEMKSHKLGAVCKALGVDLSKAHRAVHDARATGEMMLVAFEKLQTEKGPQTLESLNRAFMGDAGGKAWHIVLLAATQQGLVNLNRLVSEGHLNYFFRTPRIPRGLIRRYREGLIVGSACEAGELFRAVTEGKDEKTLERIASFYDYLEIQPIGNNAFMLKNGTARDEEQLRDFNRRIVALGEKLNKPVCATGDVHFMEPSDSIFRAIIMNAKGFEDADEQAPLYFRTTDEMLEEFAYLGPAKAMEVVVDNPQRIADMVQPLTIFPKHPEGKETFQPFWPDAENFIRTESLRRARELYGDPLPAIVQARLDKELGAICGYGFSTLYNIAVKLVKKSLGDGYIVGSRGSVGSSFVAFATGITEVNALPPHYACQNCHHVEFDVPAEYTCGLDLPPKVCPECGTLMMKDGFNIPFEVFLGFKGDKVPDIDLNFSGDYQPTAHNYVKELFGAKQVYRAGTIGTVAEKTAYGYVLKYLEQHGLTASNAEKERLAAGCTGVKRTSGQHPAGMVVVPEEYEIYQFTAIQHPADDQKSDIVTTHYDFNSMHDVLVKLDILGHDDPTMLRALQELTGIAPQQVPLNDPEVYKNIISLFRGPEALGVTAEQIGCPTGTLGIPEFGTSFVRGMLSETKPSSMEELIRISGLSHGTDVWLGNIQEILRRGEAELRTAPCTRDDIMNQLIAWGVPNKMSFDIMEFVRKGKAAKAGGVFKDGMEEAMKEHDVPSWFIEACRKIAYMFPKAHAVAYVTMALRIAYFKIYYPTEYYACWLKRNIEKFDATRMVCTSAFARNWLAEISEMPKEQRDKEDDTITMLEMIVEMTERGITLLPPELYASSADTFTIEGEKSIRAPFAAMPGLGLSAAQQLIRAREQGPFTSREEMIRRKVPKSVVETLAGIGALGDLPETSQVSLFDFM